ncbi:MAG: class I SAM-dependent methyltransferase [Planctomycetes bacterium]|nr:class I SAM-dependent methyltransferase [Planctomycetota bacterium]
MSAQPGAETLASGTSTGSVEAPIETSLNLYRFPALYDTLKAPDAEDIAAVRGLITRFVGEPRWSILDPACGPGNWLAPFAADASMLAGNDNCPEMVEYSRANTGALVTLGDMYAPPIDARFDVVLEASGVTSIVPDVDKLGHWVRTLGGMLTPRGAVILLLNFETPVPPRLPATLWRSRWRNVPGGKARIHYELVEDKPGVQHIRRSVDVRGGDWPQRIVEDYELRVWPGEVLDALKQVPGMRLMACADPEKAGKWNAAPSGARLLVFQPDRA